VRLSGDHMGLRLIRPVLSGSSGAGALGTCVPLDDVLQVSAFADHTCAVRRDGTAWCWGYNDDGELGSGDDSDAMNPRPVCLQGSHTESDCVPLDDVASIELGEKHACARLASGELWCWGDNKWGPIGNGTNDNRYFEPVRGGGGMELPPPALAAA